jgi:hypothetical protein
MEGTAEGQVKGGYLKGQQYMSLADPSDLEWTPTNRAGRAKPTTAVPAGPPTTPRLGTNREDPTGTPTTRQNPAQNWKNKEGGHPTCMHLV